MTFDPVRDERLARLQARSNAHRAELNQVNDGGPHPRSASKRRRPAKGSRGVALALSAASTLGLAGWLHANSVDTGTAAAAIPDSTASATSGSSASSTDPAQSGTTASPSASATASGATGAASFTTSDSTMADGSYTGSPVATRYGPVEVEITVANGAISDVQVVEYPESQSKSATINARALPTLVQETLTAQSAEVLSVSGATYTTTGYKSSLQSAIDAATAAVAS
jgi:uncharacterized protein with FMN-binding domain